MLVQNNLFITTSLIIFISAEFNTPIESLLKEGWARVKNGIMVSGVSWLALTDNLTQPRVMRGKASTEELPPSDRPVGVSVGGGLDWAALYSEQMVLGS